MYGFIFFMLNKCGYSPSAFIFLLYEMNLKKALLHINFY